MSRASTVNAEENYSQSKVRRNIHSCVECKRRKVRCQLSTENDAICVGCINKGIACRVQQTQKDDWVSSGVHFDEKLDRIESLLKRLVGNDIPSASGATPSASPFATSSVSTMNRGVSSENHVTSIVDKANVENGPSDVISNSLQNGVNQRYVLVDSAIIRQSLKLEEIRQTLSSLFPSQHDADLIGAATNSWALAQVFCTPANDLFQNDDPLSSFNLNAVSMRHSTIIARTLLYIAICIQQLPPEFDMTRIHLTPSLDAVMEEYISAVTKYVTSDDELTTTTEGLECLLLQGLFHLNAGNPRRAWLSFRRGLSVAQLMCMDKDFMRARIEHDTTLVKVGKQMWHQFVMSDRYVSLLLGLPCGVGDDCFGSEEPLDGVAEDVDLVFERRLSLISGHISRRNQAEPSNIFSLTQVVDEEMHRLAKEMPQSWWNVPKLDGKSRSRGVARYFNRLTTQMWYYQLETLLHLPFMLRVTFESRYDYNRHTCLTTSREVLALYITLRNAENTQLVCRVVDFAAFIAAVVIAIASIHAAQPDEDVRFQQDNKDMTLLQEIILSMESLADSSEREIVAKQSVAVLKALVKVNNLSGISTGNLRLTIPYFGVITIATPSPVQSEGLTKSAPTIRNSPSRDAPAKLQHNQEAHNQFVNAQHFPNTASGLSSQYITILSFKSSQFQSLDSGLSMDDLGWQEGDNLVFDSLLDSDISEFNSF